MSVLGWLSLAAALGACAGQVSWGQRAEVYFIKPYECDPHGNSEERLDEYDRMMVANEYPATRAWVREADKACRANNTLLGEEEQGLP